MLHSREEEGCRQATQPQGRFFLAALHNFLMALKSSRNRHPAGQVAPKMLALHISLTCRAPSTSMRVSTPAFYLLSYPACTQCPPVLRREYPGMVRVMSLMTSTAYLWPQEQPIASVKETNLLKFLVHNILPYVLALS